MSYCFQRKEKYLRIFTSEDSIKHMNHLKQLITGFSELRDPLAFLDSIRTGEISNKEWRHKRKKYPFELHERFINEIKNDLKNINEQIFKGYFSMIHHYF